MHPWQRPPCEICRKRPTDRAHITSRGAGGSDEPKNIMWLCREHHRLQHQIGIKTFVQRFNLPITFEFGYPQRTDLD